MPFTLAHPAAVLPLARGPLTLLALSAGAVAPDVPYYLRAAPLQVTAESWYEPFVNATNSHSLEHLVPVALPLALAVYAFGCLVLPPLRSIAGIETQGAAGPAGLSAGLVRGAWIVVSLTVGVLTHLVWDQLTELGGSESDLLQNGSTGLGLLVLATVAYRRRSIVAWREPMVRRNLVVTVTLCTLGALAGALVTTWSWLDPTPGLSTSEIIQGVLADGAKGAGFGLAVVAVTLAAVWWIRQLSRKASS